MDIIFRQLECRGERQELQQQNELTNKYTLKCILNISSERVGGYIKIANYLLHGC
jgi:hypothetical protein